MVALSELKSMRMSDYNRSLIIIEYVQGDINDYNKRWIVNKILISKCLKKEDSKLLKCIELEDNKFFKVTGTFYHILPSKLHKTLPNKLPISTLLTSIFIVNIKKILLQSTIKIKIVFAALRKMK